jgi:hypothetical protein
MLRGVCFAIRRAITTYGRTAALRRSTGRKFVDGVITIHARDVE